MSVQIDTPWMSTNITGPLLVGQPPLSRKAEPLKYASQLPTHAQLKRRLDALVANDQRQALRLRLDKLRARGRGVA